LRFILYSFFGGLIASAYTDFVQSILIRRAVIHVDPTAGAVGGLKECESCCRRDFSMSITRTAAWICVHGSPCWTLNGLVGVTAQPHTLLDERPLAERERSGGSEQNLRVDG